MDHSPDPNDPYIQEKYSPESSDEGGFWKIVNFIFGLIYKLMRKREKENTNG